MGYGYSNYQRVPQERMAPAEGVPHQKREGGKNANAYLVYTWHDPSKGFYLLCYGGKRRKPDAYSRYQDEAQRDTVCDRMLEAYKGKVEAANRDKKLANPLKVGDLMRSSWGYDQTNVDYYQVVKATRRMVHLRKVSGQRVEGSEGFMSCKVKPCKDNFLDDEVLKKLVQVSQDRDGKVSCYVSMSSYASAYPCSPDEETYNSWYA